MWPFLYPESASRNSCLEWDAVSAYGPVGKLHPTPDANSGSHFPPEPPTGNYIPFQRRILGRTFRNPIHPESPPHSEYIQRTHENVSRKKPRESRGFHVCTIERAASRATVYSPKTAFLAAAAMLSRSSLVGWSFAATQLSSSILNRAFSGSCSSMAS